MLKLTYKLLANLQFPHPLQSMDQQSANPLQHRPAVLTQVIERHHMLEHRPRVLWLWLCSARRDDNRTAEIDEQ